MVCPAGTFNFDGDKLCRRNTCAEEECCRSDFCAGYQCPKNMLNPNLSKKCDGKCTESECCRGVCSTFNCPAYKNKVLVSDTSKICEGSQCTENDCCTCSPGYEPKDQTCVMTDGMRMAKEWQEKMKEMQRATRKRYPMMNY